MSSGRDLPVEVQGIPKNSEWGPLLWQMLHTSAERLGKAPNHLLFLDHRREMIFVLRYVEQVMPCALCRNHYKEWRTAHPIDRLPETQSEFREAVRRWLYDLHEEVNKTHQITGRVTFEDLAGKYEGIDLKEVGRLFFALMDRAIRMKAIDRESMKKFNTHYTFLIRIL